MTAFVVVIAVGLISYLFRTSMLLAAAHGGVPPVLERAGRFAVPTAFSVIAVGALTGAPGGVAVAPVAGVFAGGLAVRRTGSVHAALLVGLPVLWALAALGLA